MEKTRVDITNSSLDIAANRRSGKWGRRELLGRVAWAFASPLFRFSPRPLWGWRRLLLRVFGADVGSEAHIYPTVRIMMPWNLKLGRFCAIGDRVTLYALGPITIGPSVTVSQNAHLCAGSHDYRHSDMPLLKPPICIEEDVWICADAFIGPNVTVGRRAIVGARGVVVRDVAPETIVAGNPARPVGLRRPLAHERPGL